MIPLAKVLVRSSGIAVIAITLGAAHPQPSAGFQVNEGEEVVLLLGGDTSASTRWIDRPDGFHVITIVDTVRHNSVAAGNMDRHSLIQFAAVLGPGQTETISVPEPQEATVPTIRIRRVGDGLQVISSACEV
jgi:hypothetical protein